MQLFSCFPDKDVALLDDLQLALSSSSLHLDVVDCKEKHGVPFIIRKLIEDELQILRNRREFCCLRAESHDLDLVSMEVINEHVILTFSRLQLLNGFALVILVSLALLLERLYSSINPELDVWLLVIKISYERLLRPVLCLLLESHRVGSLTDHLIVDVAILRGDGGHLVIVFVKYSLGLAWSGLGSLLLRHLNTRNGTSSLSRCSARSDPRRHL